MSLLCYVMSLIPDFTDAKNNDKTHYFRHDVHRLGKNINGVCVCVCVCGWRHGNPHQVTPSRSEKTLSVAGSGQAVSFAAGVTKAIKGSSVLEIPTTFQKKSLRLSNSREAGLC